MPHDFAHDPVALTNRRRKAEALVRAAIVLGATDRADLDDPDVRDAVLTHARSVDPTVSRASDETWAVARQVRAETIVHRLGPGDDGAWIRCGCTPDPVTRVLLESPGWPCQHPNPRAPAPEVPTEWGEVGLDDGSEPDWAAIRAGVWG